MLSGMARHKLTSSGHAIAGRFQLQDRPGVAVSIKDKAQGSLCLGIEFINYAQARQLELIKGQGGDAGSVARYSDYSLTLKVHGTRGILSNLKSGMRKGLYVESRYGMTSSWHCVEQSMRFAY